MAVQRRRERVAGKQRKPAAPTQGPAVYTGGHFRVVIGRIEVGFSHVGPLHLADALPASPEAGAGRARTIVLRRALTRSKELFEWRERVMAGTRDLRTVTIHQCDPAGTSIVNTWVLHRCHPVRWSGPTFDALSNEVMCEELEISWQRVEWR